MNWRESETLIERKKKLNTAKIKVLQANEKKTILWVLDTTARWNHKVQVSHEKGPSAWFGIVAKADQQSQGLNTTQLDFFERPHGSRSKGTAPQACMSCPSSFILARHGTRGQVRTLPNPNTTEVLLLAFRPILVISKPSVPGPLWFFAKIMFGYETDWMPWSQVFLGLLKLFVCSKGSKESWLLGTYRTKADDVNIYERIKNKNRMIVAERRISCIVFAVLSLKHSKHQNQNLETIAESSPPPSANWTLPAVSSLLRRLLPIWRPSDALMLSASLSSK